MRRPVLFLPLVLLAACSPVRESTAPVKAADPVKMEPVKPVTLPEPEISVAPVRSARATKSEVGGIIFEGVDFDSRSHRLVVVDQEQGPGSRFPDAAAAALSMGGLAAVNAGFFTPEGAPLGLVITAGKRAGAWNQASSLGGGIWHEDASGHSAISRREKLGRSGAANMSGLLQAGPMLVDQGRAVSGLDASKTSARTVILWDGGSRWWLGRTPPCSLADLATAIASGGPAGWPVKHALNLDGGRSSDLWISGAVSGGPVSIRPPWNRPVRNFLVLLPR